MRLPPLISVQWLHQHLDDPDLVVLDATLAKPMAAGSKIPHPNVQIPGAHFFDIDHAFSDQQVDLPHMMCDPEQFKAAAQALGINDESTVILYDHHGVYSSPRAWWMLKSMGHQQVAVLDGGLPAWVEAGFATTQKGTTDATKGNFEPAFKNECFVDAAFVQSVLPNDQMVVLDARSKARFNGEAPEPRPGLRSGHMPNARSLPFTEVLHGIHLKPVGELSKLLSPLELQGKKLIFSCGSGLTACIILLAAYVAGFEDVAVYDGSWSEWGQENGLPVV